MFAQFGAQGQEGQGPWPGSTWGKSGAAATCECERLAVALVRLGAALEDRAREIQDKHDGEPEP